MKGILNRITPEQYRRAKEITIEYEMEQKLLSKVKGKSECPFCGGSKIKPFVRTFSDQNCKDCDKEGNISNKTLVLMGLEDFIK